MLVFLISTALFCCNDVEDKSPIIENESPDWVKLEIPIGREAFAVSGDINSTLLITTWTKAFYTTDGGKNWQLSKDFQGPVDLLERNDTVFALIATGIDTKGQSYASTCNQYTTDYGKSWHRDTTGKYFHLANPIGMTESITGIIYRVKDNLTPTSPGSSAYHSNPSGIEKYDQLAWNEFTFPLKLKINNLHLDGNNRLYIAASSGVFNKDNHLVSPDDKSPALVYVSKVALP